MYQALVSNVPNEDVSELLDVIPVLHAHGDLGVPLWVPRYKDHPQAREYAPSTEADVVKQVASRIQIVHHPPTDNQRLNIMVWMKWAERISFFGFRWGNAIVG